MVTTSENGAAFGSRSITIQSGRSIDARREPRDGVAQLGEFGLKLGDALWIVFDDRRATFANGDPPTELLRVGDEEPLIGKRERNLAGPKARENVLEDHLGLGCVRLPVALFGPITFTQNAGEVERDLPRVHPLLHQQFCELRNCLIELTGLP